MRPVLPILLLVCLPLAGYADHIIGGELSMKWLGKPGSYRIRLSQYLDANATSSGNFKDHEIVYIFSKKGPALMGSYSLSGQPLETIPYKNAACAKAKNLSTYNATYVADVQLDPSQYADPGGYYAVLERCCRNHAISNLADPVDIGMVFYLEFPALLKNGVSFVNSSPTFGTLNGSFICLDKPFTASYAATDADGDQLRYSLVTPYQGYTDGNGFITGDDTPRATYPLVTWGVGYSAGNAISGSPGLQIDANTGQLSVTASQTGYFLFTVQCDEYRNGAKIGSIRRDFQIPVVDCPNETPPTPVIKDNGVLANALKLCEGSSLTLTADDDPKWAYQWQRDGINLATGKAASLPVSEAGVYTVVKSFATKCSVDAVSSGVRVDVAPLPGVAADSVAPVCAGSPAILLNGVPATGSWSGSGVTGNRFDPDKTGAGTHPVRYTVTDAAGCRNWTTRWVQVMPPLRLGGNLTYRVPRYNAVQLVLQPSVAVATVRWSPATYLNDPGIPAPTYQSGESIMYTVQAVTPLGCMATARVAVQVFDRLYLPTAFSPNGDGTNEQWRPANSERFPNCELAIYDRWGILIYQGSGMNAVWDGRYGQSVVEPGVYTYLIRTAPDEPLLSGKVTVLR